MRAARTISQLAVALGVFASVGCASDNPAAPQSRDTAPTLGTVQQDLQGLFVIEVKTGTTQAIATAVTQLGGTVRAQVPQIRMVTVAGMDTRRAAAIARRSDVVAVYRDAVLQLIRPRRFGAPLAASGSGTSSLDQSGAYFYPVQWNLPRTKVDRAWKHTTGGAGQTIWVLDSGYDPYQQDLAGKQPCYTNGITVPRYQSDMTPLDFNFHGSFVASLISSNGLGNASVAPAARVCSRKVLSEDGLGTWGDVAAAIVYAGDFGANVINLSLGGYFDSKSEGAAGLIALMQKAVDFAWFKGAVVVAASGNDAANLDRDGTMISVPAQLAHVISVGATGPDLAGNYDALASYSNYGGDTGVDLMAPGGDLPDPNNIYDLILGACSSFICPGTNYYVLAAGTSFAAPHVSAAASIVQAMLGGAPSPGSVEQCLLNGTDKIGQPLINGHGRLNVLRAAYCR